MRVLVAPAALDDALTPARAAAAIAAGWRRTRPDDELRTQPLTDGPHLLEVAAALPGARREVHEVVGPVGLARDAAWVLTADGTAVLDSDEVCGPAHVAPGQLDPRRATTWGVGELLAHVRERGVDRVLLALGGTAAVDGGAGALGGLGFRVTVADGSGLKMGGEDLHRVRGVARGWAAGWDAPAVTLLPAVRTPLAGAATALGPAVGADPATVAHLQAGLDAWRAVCEQDLDAPPALATAPGAGAAGGLAYGLLAALGDVRLALDPDGSDDMAAAARAVAGLVGLDALLEDADVVVTGPAPQEGAAATGGAVAALLGARAADRGLRLHHVHGDGPEALADAAAVLAGRP